MWTPQLRRIGRQGNKDPWPSSNSGPTLYHRVSATQASDPSHDPLSPIVLKYRSWVAAIQRPLIRPTSRGWYSVQCDDSRLSITDNVGTEFKLGRWFIFPCRLSSWAVEFTQQSEQFAPAHEHSFTEHKVDKQTYKLSGYKLGHKWQLNKYKCIKLLQSIFWLQVIINGWEEWERTGSLTC